MHSRPAGFCFGVGIGFVVTMAASSVGAIDHCLREIGRWPYGAVNALIADGDIIFSNSGSVLQIVRFITPDTLEPVSEVVLADAPWQLALTGDHIVAVLGDHGMQIIDVSDIQEPTIVGSSRVEGFAAGGAVAGNVAWVAAGHSGVWGFDISDPTGPRLLGGLLPAHETNGLTVADGILWAATSSGLHAIDISDPRRPIQISFAVRWGSFNVVVRDNLAYVAAGGDWGHEGL